MGAIDYYTYNDYAQWKGDWELIGGEAVAMAPSPMVTHQAIAAQFIFEMLKEIDECKGCMVLAKEDWKIDEATVVRPDVVLTCNEKGQEHLTKTPEIVVEIVSRQSARKDEQIKFALYEAEKVPYYILIYPNETKAKIYRLIDGYFSKEGDFFDEEYTFEGLTCKATISFARLFRKFRKGA